MSICHFNTNNRIKFRYPKIWHKFEHWQQLKIKKIRANFKHYKVKTHVQTARELLIWTRIFIWQWLQIAMWIRVFMEEYSMYLRFSVNLVNGRDKDSDIAFHFNPRRGDRQVVMNNRINGNWQREERQALPEAFIDNKPFEIKFIIKRRKFKVSKRI